MKRSVITHALSAMALATSATLLGAALSPASAAVQALGAGMARSCFEAATLLRDPARSVELCTNAIHQEGLDARDLAATYVNRGILRMRSADREGALADFDRAIKLMPRLGDAYVNRGVLLIAGKQDRAAIDSISRGLDVGCERPAMAHYTRAIAYELIGDFRAAYLDYRRAAELEPEWAEPRDQMGRFSVRKYG